MIEAICCGSVTSYVDPEVVVGCEDGRARVFDMYGKKWSRIIKMHEGPVTCLSFSDDQLLIGGFSYGRISLSDLSSDQQVAALKTNDYAVGNTACDKDDQQNPLVILEVVHMDSVIEMTVYDEED
ncbi:F-box/WD-40 repeat-containing protein [Tanacetum coccineum]